MQHEILGGPDTIKLRTLDPELISDKLLEGCNYSRKRNGNHIGETWSHPIDNLYFTWGVSYGYLTGSISRFQTGCNSNTLSKGQIEEALDRLSNIIGADVFGFELQQLDWAVDIDTTEPPGWYFGSFGELSTRKKMPMENTIYWKIGPRKLRMYDKILQMKAKRIRIPEIMVGKNVFRIESSQQPKNATARDLLSDQFRTEAFKTLLNDYEDIFKIGNVMIQNYDWSTPDTLKDLIVADWLTSSQNWAIAYKSIDEKRSAGVITSQSASKVRKILMDIQTKYTDREAGSRADEITMKLGLSL